jgi:hypothetical protein
MNGKYDCMSLYFQDESRFGLITRNGRMLTAKGVKPVCPFQQVFRATWLYGAFSPITGDNYMLEFSSCDSECFQIFIDEFSQRNPNQLSVMVLDNAAFHASTGSATVRQENLLCRTI